MNLSREMFEDVSVFAARTRPGGGANWPEACRMSTSAFESRPRCLQISAQQDAVTSGRVILCCQLTLESRPEERVQQVQVWRSGRLEDDVPSREWHVFFIPCLGSGTCREGTLSMMHKKLSMASHSGITCCVITSSHAFVSILHPGGTMKREPNGPSRMLTMPLTIMPGLF